MAKFLGFVNGIVWGAPALVLILGAGLYLSFCTGFAQLRLFPKALSEFLRKLRPQQEHEGVSSFQAMCTALAATVGTGNLVGVAGAICLGGPGSIFWMWICGILGMVTKFAEATLAVHFRSRENGEWVGGPMYMIQNGLGPRWRPLAWAYCFFGVFAAFGVGNATQINACITGINAVIEAFGGSPNGTMNLLIGLTMALIVGMMLLGGAKRIGQAAELLVPFVSCAYIVLCGGVLILRFREIPGAFHAIIYGAFSPRAVTGGILGSAFLALRVGVSRGVFTNEAGMGTASIAHAAAKVEHPVQQGLMGIMEVFLDTIVICTMTALVILCSGVPIPFGVDAGAELTAAAFTRVYGDWVNIFLAVALCCFAFATVLGWGLYGARCAQFLFGPGAWKVFSVVQICIAILSSLLNTGIIWSLSETVNGLMAIPNLITLVLLSPKLRALTMNDKQQGGHDAAGGTYENFNQRKPLSALSHAEVPSLCSGSKKTGQKDLPSEHRTAGSAHASGIL